MYIQWIWVISVFTVNGCLASIEKHRQASGFTFQVLCVFAWTTYKQCPGPWGKQGNSHCLWWILLDVDVSLIENSTKDHHLQGILAGSTFILRIARPFWLGFAWNSNSLCHVLKARSPTCVWRFLRYTVDLYFAYHYFFVRSHLHFVALSFDSHDCRCLICFPIAFLIHGWLFVSLLVVYWPRKVRLEILICNIPKNGKPISKMESWKINVLLQRVWFFRFYLGFLMETVMHLLNVSLSKVWIFGAESGLWNGR